MTRRSLLAAATALAALATGFGGDADRDGILDGALTPEQAAQRPAGDQLIVSIGDSVASGEGNPDVRGTIGRPPRWQLERCHRSLLSGHAQAALLAESDDPAHDVAFVPLGCSGATVLDGLLGPYRGQRRQVDEVNDLADRIDALLLSVGANDSLFATIVNFCLTRQRCEQRPFRGQPSLRVAVDAAIADLKRRYQLLDDALSAQIDRDRVVIVEYFDPTVGTDGRFCSLPIGPALVDSREARWMHDEVLGPLNEAVHAAANEHGWRIVDGVDEAFAGHGICVRPQREVWVRTFEQSIFRQNLSHRGTLHPNQRGHRQTARLIHPVLADVLGVASGADPGDDDSGDDDESDILDDRDLLLAILAVVAALVVVALLIRRARSD